MSPNEIAKILGLAHIFIRDMESRITFWSSGAARLYGFTNEEASGSVSHELLETQFPISREVVEKALRETGEWEGELIHTRRDGTMIEVESHQVVYRDEAGQAVAILEVNNDITAVKRRKAALRKNEERFAHLAATAPGALLAFQVGRDGSIRFPYASPAVTHIFGLEPEILREDGSGLFSIIHPDDRKAMRSMIFEAGRAMEPWRGEYRVLNPMRGELWVEAYFTPTQDSDGTVTWYGFANDITERKHREEELRASKQRLQTALDAATIGLWDWNLQSGEIVWEGQHDRLFGYSSGEFDGRFETFFQRIHPEDRKGLELAIERARSTRSPYGHSYRLIKPNGDIHWMTTTGRFYYNDGGEPIRMAGAIMDVTAYKETEEEISQLQKTTKQQARLLGIARHTALDILASKTGKEAVEHLAETARRLVNARYAAIGICSGEGTAFEEFITVGMTPDEEHRIGKRPTGGGLLGFQLRQSECVRLDNIASHPAASGFPANHPAMTRFLGVPIHIAGIVRGSLYLTDKQDGTSFTEADAETVSALSAHIAVAIRNLQMIQRHRALVQSLITVQEEERRAIAYDLHDGLTQYVIASHAFLESCQEAQAAGDQDHAQTMMESAVRYLKEAVTESRRLVNGLRALFLEDLGLAGALEQLLEEEKARVGWAHTEFSHNIGGEQFDISLQTTLYRIAQEALNNARKHSGARKVQVQLLLEPGYHTGESELTLKVRDWGCGFDPSTIPVGSSHIGLHGMGERVRLMDGRLDIQSAIGKGTTITAVFPVRLRSGEVAGETGPTAAQNA